MIKSSRNGLNPAIGVFDEVFFPISKWVCKKRSTGTCLQLVHEKKANEINSILESAGFRV